jgi:hypothetical protein
MVWITCTLERDGWNKDIDLRDLCFVMRSLRFDVIQLGMTTDADRQVISATTKRVPMKKPVLVLLRSRLLQVDSKFLRSESKQVHELLNGMDSGAQTCGAE